MLAAAPPPEGARGVAVAGRLAGAARAAGRARRSRWRSAAGYNGAGTVEFIADADDPATHFFLEMNARLQVEHPVTELVTGLDLVELQLRVAAGERARRRAWTLHGHAIEARINAEDAQLLPVGRPGPGSRAIPDGVRVDAAVETGSVVGTDYDSMIAKVIAHGPDRATALARLDRALADTAILGLTTNTGFLRSLLAHEGVRAGEMDTGLIGRLEPAAPPLADERGGARGGRDRARRGRRARRRRPVRAPRRLAPRRRRAPSYWKLAVDGGEPLDVVLDEAERSRREFRSRAPLHLRRDGVSCGSPRGLERGT